MLKKVLFLILLVLISGCMRRVGFQTVDKHYLLLLHNTERLNRNIESLEHNYELEEMAQAHAAWMAEEDSLEHQQLQPGQGENIAWGQTTEIQAVQDWMESPGHKRNILNRQFKTVGFGFHDRYWCAVFEMD